MQKQWVQASSASSLWRVMLVLSVCLIVHFLLLRVFIKHNALIDPRVDWRNPPVQVQVLAPPDEPKPPARVEPPPAESQQVKPIARPRPAVRPRKTPPPPASRSTNRPGAETVAASPEPPANESSSGDQSDLITAETALTQTAGSITGGTQAGGEAGAAARESDMPAKASAEKNGPGDAGVPADAADPSRAPKLIYGVKLPPPPAPGVWTYSVHLGDYDKTGSAAVLKLAFENDGSHYAVRAEVAATGLTAFFYGGVRKDFSKGRITENGLLPARYSEQRNKNTERVASVDYAKNEIQFAGGEIDVLQGPLQDRLSGLFQLGILARARPDLFAPGQIVEFSELNLRTVQPVRFKVEGPQELKTSLGLLRTLQLTRQRSANGNEPELEVWLDYDFAMLPVRIRLTDSSQRVIDQLIDKKD